MDDDIELLEDENNDFEYWSKNNTFISLYRNTFYEPEIFEYDKYVYHITRAENI